MVAPKYLDIGLANGNRKRLAIGEFHVLLDRILGAFTFRKDIYAEVKNDSSFTLTAWGIVAVVAFINNLILILLPRFGTGPSFGIFDLIVDTVIEIGAFAVAAFIVGWFGKALFQEAESTFSIAVRTLGLAYVWRILFDGFEIIGFGGSYSSSLIVGSVVIVIVILPNVMAIFIAAREALQLDVLSTILILIFGLIAVFLYNYAINIILDALNLYTLIN